MYHITIKWQHGAVTRATVTASTLKGFKLSACKGAAVSIVKVKS
jgi:hypothetical protein